MQRFRGARDRRQAGEQTRAAARSWWPCWPQNRRAPIRSSRPCSKASPKSSKRTRRRRGRRNCRARFKAAGLRQSGAASRGLAAHRALGQGRRHGRGGETARARVDRRTQRRQPSRRDDARRSSPVLLGVRQMNRGHSAVRRQTSGVVRLAQACSAALSKRSAARPMPAVGATAGRGVSETLRPKLQDAAFAQIIKRSEWSLALVEALKSGNVTFRHARSGQRSSPAHAQRRAVSRAGQRGSRRIAWPGG